MFDPNEEQDEENLYSVKEKVAEDVKKLAATDTAKSKAEDFIAQAVKDGWQSALDSFNKLHKEQYGQDPNDPNDPGPFTIQNRGRLRKIPAVVLDTMALHRKGDPAGRFFMYSMEREKLFADKLSM